MQKHFTINTMKKSRIENIRQKLIQEFGNEIKDVILFGSRAVGNAKNYSDYDILIVLNKENYDWKYKYRILDILYDIELENDIIIDPHIVSEHELNNTLRGVQPIFINALQSGVYL